MSVPAGRDAPRCVMVATLPEMYAQCPSTRQVWAIPMSRAGTLSYSACATYYRMPRDGSQAAAGAGKQTSDQFGGAASASML